MHFLLFIAEAGRRMKREQLVDCYIRLLGAWEVINGVLRILSVVDNEDTTAALPSLYYSSTTLSGFSI